MIEPEEVLHQPGILRLLADVREQRQRLIAALERAQETRGERVTYPLPGRGSRLGHMSSTPRTYGEP